MGDVSHFPGMSNPLVPRGPLFLYLISPFRSVETGLLAVGQCTHWMWLASKWSSDYLLGGTVSALCLSVSGHIERLPILLGFAPCAHTHRAVVLPILVRVMPVLGA